MKKNILKYLIAFLAIIISLHFLFTYFKPNVKNPWSIIIDNVSDKEEKGGELRTETRTITKSSVKTKFLTTTSTVTVEHTTQPTQEQKPQEDKGALELELPTKQETMPIRKAKAAFVVLIKNSDLKSFRTTMVQLEQRFNRKYNYPYVFLNNEEFSEEFKSQVRSLTKSECEFGLIPPEQWSVPSFIDVNKMYDAMERMTKQEVLYGGSLNYRHMCRFESGFFYRHELLKKYDYYWRVEPGVDFYCNMDFDPFIYMQDNDIKYGFTVSLYEYSLTIETLWDRVKEFTEAHPDYIEEDNWMKFISDNDGETYNLCHFWSNFEIADLRLWRGEAYSKFFDFLDDKGGFFYERWGDAPVHSIAAALFLKKHQIHFFNEIGYKHPPFTHCPTEEEFRGKCSCDPADNFDYEGYSCTKRWKNLVERFNVKFPSKYSFNSTYVNK